eukprot:s1698_g7.t1
MPLYTSVATTFADLHDRAGRMKAKGVIRESISWKDSRRYFYWRVKRRVLQDYLISRLRKVDTKLTHKDSEALIQKWAAENNVDFNSDMKMVAWLESQNVDARAESIRTSFLKSHIKDGARGPPFEPTGVVNKIAEEALPLRKVATGCAELGYRLIARFGGFHCFWI